MTMKPEIKQRWLDALRSGKFRQTNGMLHRYGGGYCCLGVLCELAVQEGLINTSPMSDDRSCWGYGTHSQHTTYLPPEVVEWAGLDDAVPSVDDHGLDSLNDTGVKFPQIADLIEYHL